MVRDGRSCPARKMGNLELDVRTNDLGCPVLYFPFMSCSDIHLGTKHSRAKRLCHMLEHNTTDKADRLLRLIYRIAPPRDRQRLVADMAVKAL
jgi:hypothetical protein